MLAWLLFGFFLVFLLFEGLVGIKCAKKQHDDDDIKCVRKQHDDDMKSASEGSMVII